MGIEWKPALELCRSGVDVPKRNRRSRRLSPTHQSPRPSPAEMRVYFCHSTFSLLADFLRLSGLGVEGRPRVRGKPPLAASSAVDGRDHMSCARVASFSKVGSPPAEAGRASRKPA